ncbi:CinA family nicotinamide mononucleotide deamidase-related protein [Deinococcus sp. QL22]|uniref:CinA family nicotinamide mononucleotide deamidase-related protein n=1 Tax=Deinococcus sp. QL22 TaxID=2939437 RepID=UPI002017B3AD|nr:CinA family nicotinamide mononucleotide deamidase-related protein [Deinococcus sp. QL22]UQN07459.1 CinA family nicotinamide mononucleotide deamidase-related protein [Deinococcus sp. QL22]
MLLAEIISVGTELLLGEIVDSNAAFLARELAERGVTLHRKTVLGDNLGRVTDAITLALSRADLVILGGGLGPTDDDLTREAIAAALGETPTEDPEQMAHLRGLYESRGRAMPEVNRKQAWLIPSAEALANPVGTAPGWFVRVLPVGVGAAPDSPSGASTGKLIVALPGPPFEMHRMWREQVLPRLPLPARAFHAVTLHTQGIGESNVAELLGALTRQANPSVATYARKTGVDVRVAASAPTPQEAEALAAPVLEQVRGLLARWTWGEDGDTLASVLTRALGTRTLGVIEAGSGGTVCAALADAPNFLDAAVTVDHARLITLGLTPVTLNAYGVVSEQAARELAAGAREYLGAAVGLAVVTATAGALAGQTYIALDTGELQKTAHLNWPGDAPQVRERAAMAALALALRSLQTRDEVQA